MNILKELRKKINLTQKQFAEKINITEACYKNYENGYSEMPYDVLIKVADFHNISIDTLLSRKVKGIDFSLISSEKLELFKKIAKLPDSSIVKIAGYIDALLDGN